LEQNLQKLTTLNIDYSYPTYNNYYGKETIGIDMVSSSVNPIQTGATSTNFHITRQSTIPSDGAPHKVTIGTLKLQSNFSHYSVPKLDTNVFLKVKTINDTDFPLLPGTMNVFFDNNFIATGFMKSVSPKEEFESFLGVDPAVKIEYRPVKRTTEYSGVLTRTSKMTVERKNCNKKYKR